MINLFKTLKEWIITDKPFKECIIHKPFTHGGIVPGGPSRIIPNVDNGFLLTKKQQKRVTRLLNNDGHCVIHISSTEIDFNKED